MQSVNLCDLLRSRTRRTFSFEPEKTSAKTIRTTVPSMNRHPLQCVTENSGNNCKFIWLQNHAGHYQTEQTIAQLMRHINQMSKAIYYFDNWCFYLCQSGGGHLKLMDLNHFSSLPCELFIYFLFFFFCHDKYITRNSSQKFGNCALLQQSL